MREIKYVSEIHIGDMVVNKLSGNAYIITDIIDGYPLGVRTIQITNPSEWESFGSGQKVIDRTTLTRQQRLEHEDQSERRDELDPSGGQ